MVKDFSELQQVGKESVETAMKSAETLSKGAQAIAVEVADYSKKAFEDGTAALEKLFGVKSLRRRSNCNRNMRSPATKASWPRPPRSASSTPTSPRKATSRSKP
jgi:hypothetical protein